MNIAKSRKNSNTKKKSEIYEKVVTESEIYRITTIKVSNDKNQIPTAINKSTKNDLEKLNSQIEEMKKLLVSQNEEINRLQNELNSEKLKNLNLSIDLEKAKHSTNSTDFKCKCNLYHEIQSKQIEDSHTQILCSDSENTLHNMKINKHTKSTESKKKYSERNKSPFESIDALKLDETNGYIDDVISPTNKNKKKLKFVRSSSLVINPIHKEEEMILKKSRKRMNFSQDIIVNDYRKRKNEIDELFDDDMEKLIKRLKWSRTNFQENPFLTEKKKFQTLNKLASFDNFMTKEEKRKKFISDFRTHCRENKQMLKTIAKNTESKLKTYLQINSNTNVNTISNKHNNKNEKMPVKKSRRLHSVDIKGKLEADSVVIHTRASRVLGESSSRKNSKFVIGYNSKDKILVSARKDFEKNKINLENKILPNVGKTSL